MRKETKAFAIIGLFCIIGIAACILANMLLPLTFSGYFVICILSLLSIIFIEDKAKLIIPWSVTAAASVIITLNYLHPDISVFSNADYHALVMQGLDKKDSVLLIGKDKSKSLFDKEGMEGFVSIAPSNKDNTTCQIRYELTGAPLFTVVEGSRTGRLINKRQLPSFRKHLSIGNDSVRCDINITDIDDKSIRVSVAFKHQTGDETAYQPSFKRAIRVGYNLYDILHSGVSYQPSEESLLAALRNSLIVRDYDEQDRYFMTYSGNLGRLQIACDGNQFQQKKRQQVAELGKDTYFCLGIGSQATRPMRASFELGNVCLRYRFPYINNFPGLSDEPSPKENRQKIVAITSRTASLLKTNVKEAFYYPLFEREDNEYHFNGNIIYRINNSQTPFKTSLSDDHESQKPSDSTLISKNDAVWHFSVCNLRESSPVTGEGNICVKDSTIVGLVFLMLFLAFLYAMILTEGHTSRIVMTACLFAIPLFVMRTYLLWRIAVFPPVADITLSEFLRYRMELPNLLENPELVMIGLWLIPLFVLIAMLLKPIFSSLGSRRISIESYAPKKLQIFFQDWGHAVLFGILLSISIATVCVIKFAHINIVGLNILVPVIIFLINEYIVARWLSIGFRITNAIVTLAALFFCDPGYAIMFFIFECVYFSIILYAFLIYRWREYSSGKAAGFYFFWILIIAIVGTVILLPTLVPWTYSSQPSFLGFVSTSRLMFILLPLSVGGILIYVLWRWKEYESRTSYWLAGIALVTIVACSSTIGYDWFQTHNLHFKYRAVIHSETVGEIMQDERYGEDDAQRLLNAAQNQWFLQYHNNKGEERVTQDGLLSLSPHFKKGVTWNTQISDVILSRYVIGELSALVPLFMILLVVAFVWVVFHSSNESPAGRALTFAVALLFLIQSTFEWMAVTNRTIFFGQDFPFLSQNARFTLYMFGIWLILFVVFACFIPKSEDNDGLESGLDQFARPFQQAFFFILFTVVVGIVYLWGNNYERLYANELTDGDKSNAEEFNISTAMSESDRQLKDINARLSEFHARGRHLENNEDISQLVREIEDSTRLSQYVEKLREKGAINEFTYSLYQAFSTNLKRKNSNGNIIHLRHYDIDTYELALNMSYFNLQSPEYDRKAWKGNVYSDVSDQNTDRPLLTAKLPGLVVYSIPSSWLPSGKDYAIADGRFKDGHIGDYYETFIHKDMADYTVSSIVFPVSADDFLELRNKKSHDVINYQYGRDEQNLLVKNMVINGKRKFFYPLKEKCLWLRDLSNLIAYSKQGAGNKDSVFVTLDSRLTATLSDSLKKFGNECSVVALDGFGNVRVMADYKASGAIDPNNEKLIYELAVQSYMNPNSETDQNLFGNLNLCYLKPGPGSSLKPITYAAVTSQSLDFNWGGLELMSPKHISNPNVGRIAGKHFHIRKFGPRYKYSAKRPFRSIVNDETGIDKNGLGWINNDFYLYRSSNYYNALVTYLGHYDNLADAETRLFTVSTNINDFPRFRTDNSGKVFTFRDAPHAKANLLLFDGLTKNFKVPTFTGYVDSLRYEFIHPSFYKKNSLESKAYLASRFSWVFPQESTIYDYEMEESVLTPAERLRQYTLGSSPVKVTPMKMAEMYGKLYSLHPDYHATVIPRHTRFIEPWLDNSGNPSKSYLSFYSRNLFKGMSNCAQIGTAKYLGKEINGYHIFAKTGTLSLGGDIPDDRMLAVVICNKDLTEANNITSSDDYRFMVVYFRFKQCTINMNHYKKHIRSIIHEIIKSNSFQNYMR